MLMRTPDDALIYGDLNNNTPLHVAVDVFRWQNRTTETERDNRIHLIQELTARYHKASINLNNESQSPFKCYLKGSKDFDYNGRPQELCPSLERETIENKGVRSILRDAYIHLPALEARQALHGCIPGPQIGLDLSELKYRKEPLPDDFLDVLRRLELEEDLRPILINVS